MKLFNSVLVVAALLVPALPGISATSSEISIQATQSELVEAAGALSYRAQLALQKVQDLALKGTTSDLSKAIRLSRFINVDAYELSLLLEDSASEDELLDKLNDLETYVLQLDATKRALLKVYPKDTALLTTLNDVRRTFYYLKELLTGEV